LVNPLKEEQFMKTRTRFLALATIAAFAIAGCGEDNNDNGGGGTEPTRTPTPAQVTQTPTPGVVSPTVTPTTVTSTSPDSPTPTVTSTPGTIIDCNGEGAALNITITSEPGSDLDTGWTGISHNSVATHDNVVTTQLNCVGPDCVVDGSALTGTTFGSPLPLSAGGVSTCIVNTFREAVTGTYNCESGCSTGATKLVSKVFLVQEASMPCPPCVGDATPNDGVKGGTCSGGKTPGAACDVGGISDLFDAAGPEFGHTSNDCLPTGSSVGELNIDLDPLTTGTVSVDSNVNCLSGAFPAGSCFCPGQVQPNACFPDGVCPASGVCEVGPIDGVCQGQTFRQCRSGTGTEDCEDVFPGAGSCIDQPRPCFGTNITRTGTCGTVSGTLVSFFCIPQTRAAAINTTAGLPGPGAISLPVSQVRTPR
jgi:hypothetical protein